jgi:AcrR family transcriptional regulator
MTRWTHDADLSTANPMKAEATTGRRPGGRGAGLTREQIVQAAITLMDGEGVDALTVRGLARALDVESAALYWHFASKDDICRAVVEEISAQIRVETSARGTPRKRLEQHLAAIRAHWRRHPSALELSRRFPPSVARDVARAGMDLLVALGIPPDDALDRYRVLSWSVTGFVIVEQNLARSVHHTPAGTTGTRWVLAIEGSEGAPSEFDSDELFHTTIGLLLDGMLASNS